MIQEEKARRYDEALERARKCLDEKRDTCFVRPDVIFPELRESEDERIRKVLIDLVKCNERSGYTLLNNVTTDSILAWLEKQCDKDKLIQELGKYKVKYTQEILSQQLEKQGENPKWSEEDDYNVQCCIAKAESDIANGCTGRNKELIDWLKSLKQRIGG
jgi:hypothetical protein